MVLAAPGACGEASAPAGTNLPAPGAYVLHRIQRVPEARLLDADGNAVNLSSVARGAVTALGFFYSQCVDPAGCPVAWSVFESVRREAETDALLRQKLRLVFISLDPAHDTPAVIRLLQNSEGGGETLAPWKFFTGASYDDLTPLLHEMGQDIAIETDAAGRRTGVINHLLKVFLIDPDGWVREIYTTAFLTSESLLNDARTLAMTYP
jgi:cytochrome oxidase Cu insertion factor (SCO1/SenC/PrrC family)